MKATTINGDLVPIPSCYIKIPITGGIYQIDLKILPEISDSKSATYHDEAVPGRSFPIKIFDRGENRNISMKIHLVILKDADAAENIQHLRALQSAVYPREALSSPYLPPPVCKLRVGHLLSKQEICAVLKDYNVSFPNDVVWYQSNTDTALYLPYKFAIDLKWEAVFPSTELPGQDKIFSDI